MQCEWSAPARPARPTPVERLTLSAHEAAMPPRRALVRLTIVVALSTSAAPSRALVGAAPDGRFADRVAMVLMRGRGEAGFCSALVLDSRTLLTAAHCLRPTRDMAVHYRDASGAPVVIPVEAAAAHPLYRPDAIRSRVESIDVALIRTASPLGPGFAGAALASGGGPAVGDRVILSGYGATREATGSPAANCEASRSRCANRLRPCSSGRPTPTAGSPGPARAIPARRSSRPTAPRRSRSPPGRRRRTAAAAAA